MSQKNVEAAREAIDAFNRRDLDGAWYRFGHRGVNGEPAVMALPRR
jgi:hypothetical protein